MAIVNMPPKAPDQPPSVERRKKTGIAKAKDIFIAVDKDEFWNKFTENLLYPNVLNLVVRLAHGAVDILFNGNTTYSGYTVVNPFTQTNPYHNITNPVIAAQTNYNKPLGKSGIGYSLDEVTYASWDEAMYVITQLNGIISQSKVADCYAFFELSKLVPDYTDKNWGWTEVMNIKPLLNKDGRYFLPLPKPKYINQGGR